jgi:hypothetical protein
MEGIPAIGTYSYQDCATYVRQPRSPLEHTNYALLCGYRTGSPN